MKLITTALLLLALSLVLSAQTATAPPAIGQPWQQAIGFVPNTSTAVTTSNSFLQFLYLANATSSTVTVTLTDNSTACSSGACTIWPTVSIAANSVYVASLGGMYVTGGVKWSAGTATAVVGYMLGNYTANLVTEVWPLDLEQLVKSARYEPPHVWGATFGGTR